MRSGHKCIEAKALERKEALKELDISIMACANGNVLGDSESVRLFVIEYIKGMEFEVVFFVDIDVMARHVPELIDKFVYVGLSRANLYLGVTVEQTFPESLGYLEPLFETTDTWLL